MNMPAEAPARAPVTDLAAYVDGLSSEARTVIRELGTWNDDKVRYIRTIAQEIGIPVESIRRIVRALERDGFATYGPLYDSDSGAPNGSSYWLTQSGVALRTALEGFSR